jgi:iron complex outermembrane receptor protein
MDRLVHRSGCGIADLLLTPAHAALVSLVGLALALSIVAAQAQEEIIVTAERRETSLQDTPISVLAFSAESLEFKGVEDLEDLATNAPNLDIKGSRGTGNVSPTYEIRGVSGGGGTTGERGVGFYLDGVYVPRQTGPFMKVLDIERIEILRGPQGTLFGRNSVGGAIRVFTRKPSEEPEGYLKVTGGNFDRYDISAMFNAPVNDSLAVRGQAAYLHQDGYVDRGPQELGSSEDIILRLQAAWTPRNDLQVTVGATYLDSESDGNPQDLEFFDMAPVDPINGVSSVISFQGGYADWISDFLEAAGQPRLSNNDPRLVLDDYTMPDYCFLDDPDPDWDELCAQVNESSYWQIDGTVEWEISDQLSLTSITGYSDFESFGITDWQLLGMERRPTTTESWTFYQELQLNAALFDDRVDLVTGVSYFHETASTPREFLLQVVGTSDFNSQMANGNAWAGQRRTGDIAITQKADSLGWFASGTWRVTDDINLTSGVRVAYDVKDIEQTEFLSDDFAPDCLVALAMGACPAGMANPAVPSTTVTADDSWTEADWRVTLDYQITDDVMIYGTASKAYRAGSYSITILDDVPGELQSDDYIEPIPPEKLVNYEGGVRTEWFDGRLRVNATYFDMDYSNRQNPAAVADLNAPTGFVIRLTNQGDVDLQGIELDGQLSVTERFTIDGNAGWVDYALEDICVNNGIYLFPAPSERGYSVGGRYDHPFADIGGTVSFSMNFSWVGPQATHPGGVTSGACGPQVGPFPPTAEWFLDSRYKLDSYGLLSARIRYASDDGRWVATLFGNNLTDNNYANFATRFGGGFWEGAPPAPVGLKAPLRSALGMTRGRPLEWGITLQYNFFR